MSTMSVLLRGAAWTYGAQAATIVIQLAYTSVTSHVIAPTQFGGYAVAILVTGLATLISNGGMGPAVTRMTSLDRGRLVNLMTFGAVVGIVIAVATIATADFWAAIWGNPDAAPLIRLLSISVLASPLNALVSGLIRRMGSFRTLAALTFGSNVAGMVLGATAALVLHSGLALVVSPIVSQVGLVVGGYLATDRMLFGLPRRRQGLDDARFGVQLTAQSLLSYVILNAGPFSIAHYMGPYDIGQWNRADALTTSPSYTLQNAVNQTLAPEFRHDIENGERAERVWTDLLALCAWFSLPIGVFVAVVVPFLIPHLLGPQWLEAADIAVVLGLAGGVKITVSVLGGALETLGRFKTLWIIQIALLALQVPVVALAIITRSPVLVAWGLLVTNLLQHALQIGYAARIRYLRLGALMKQYALAAATAAVMFALGQATFSLIERGQAVGAVAVGSVIVVAGGVAFLRRRSLPPVALLGRYRAVRQ